MIWLGDYSCLLRGNVYSVSCIPIDDSLSRKDQSKEMTWIFTRWAETIHPSPLIDSSRRGSNTSYQRTLSSRPIDPNQRTLKHSVKTPYRPTLATPPPYFLQHLVTPNNTLSYRHSNCHSQCKKTRSSPFDFERGFFDG